jgi:adenylate cyclase
MGYEIEHKFLVANEGWRVNAAGRTIRQGYLAVGPPVAIRVRISGDKAILNIKKAVLDVRRDEFEYAIPLADANHLLANLCEGHIIEKTRYDVVYAGKRWEIDVFEGANAGLLVAEIELDAVGDPFDLPPWVGEEVSHDPRYLNSSLSLRPYTTW